MQLWLCPLLAFLSGSIPFGLLLAKSRGVDIRKHGSGNIGATNVWRVMGKKFGIPCLILDMLKGALPTLATMSLIRFEGQSSSMVIQALVDHAYVFSADKQFLAQTLVVGTGLLCIIGHNYSPWVGFKGGKGIATSAGVIIALMPAAIVILIAVWVLLFFTTRYVSVASIGAAIVLPILTHLGARFHHVNNDANLPNLWQAGTWNKPLFIFSVTIAVLAIWKHRSNIQRLREGTENRFTRKSKSRT